VGQTTLSEAGVLEVERLKQQGFEVFGPGPMTPGETTPTPDTATPMPGSHVQIRAGHRLIEGFGATGDEALRDALMKLEGYDPDGRVVGV
jgi:hypothetical protein